MWYGFVYVVIMVRKNLCPLDHIAQMGAQPPIGKPFTEGSQKLGTEAWGRDRV